MLKHYFDLLLYNHTLIPIQKMILMNIVKYTLDTYQKFQEKNLFIKIFQIVLFIWIFSIPLKSSIYQISTVLIIIIFFVHYFYYKQKTIVMEILLTYKKLFIVFLLFIAERLNEDGKNKISFFGNISFRSF